jgi:hypothetical protein
MAARLEDIDEAYNVALDVGARIEDRVPDTGLRSEVDYPVESVAREAIVYGILVGEICPDEFIVADRPRGCFVENSKARLLQRGVVVIIYDIKPDYRIAALEESLGNVEADEAGIARD